MAVPHCRHPCGPHSDPQRRPVLEGAPVGLAEDHAGRLHSCHLGKDLEVVALDTSGKLRRAVYGDFQVGDPARKWSGWEDVPVPRGALTALSEGYMSDYLAVIDGVPCRTGSRDTSGFGPAETWR